MRQGRWLGLLVVVAVVVAGGTWALADRSSPKRRQVVEPASTLLTVPVESRDARSSIVLRADVGFAGEEQVALAGVPAQAQRPVATLLPAVHVKISPGEVLFELSGTPVFLLTGTIAPYRTIVPGDTGVDVRQLQEALSALGLYNGSIDGVYGLGTIDAFERLYSDRGYPPPPPSAEAAGSVEAAEAELAAIQAQATPSGDGAGSPTTRAAQVSDARRRIEEARFRSRTPVPMHSLRYSAATPVTVTGLDVLEGDVIEGPVLRFSSGDLEARAQVSDSTAASIEVGMPVVLQETASSPEISAKVAKVSQETNSDGGAGVEIQITSVESLAALNGKNVRAEVTPRSGGGRAEPVLVVPVSALTTRGDGRTLVVVADADGQHEVEVEAGPADPDGMVAVEPLSGDLSVNDEVVVGIRNA